MTDQIILTSYFIDEPVPAFDALAEPGWTQVSAVLPDGDQQDRVAPLHQAIADEVASALARSQRPVSLAGDCCAALGVMTGLQRAGMSLPRFSGWTRTATSTRGRRHPATFWAVCRWRWQWVWANNGCSIS